MNHHKIDSIAEIKPESVTLEGLRYYYATGVDTTTGTGRFKTHSYRNGVQTELGDIKENIWYQLMEALVEQHEERWLLDALIQWHKAIRGEYKTYRSDKQWALEVYSHRIFDNEIWVDFIPFNQQYRPERLQHVAIVTVVNECCLRPSLVTKVRLDNEHEKGKTICPHCGCWSNYSIVET